MNNHTLHIVDDVFTWTKTLTIDLPFASTQWALGAGREETVTATAWQGYDAGVRVLTATIDAFYQTPLSGTILDRVAAAFFHWQHVSNAVTGAVFSLLRHTADVPTTAELRLLEETIAHLATEVREQREVQEVLMHLATRLLHSVETTERTNLSDSRFRTYAAPPHQLPPTVTRTAHHKGN